MALVCDRCGSTFNLPHNLRAHWKRQTPCLPTLSSISAAELMAKYVNKVADKKRVECACGKRFATSKTLQVHQEKCTESADKKRIRELEALLQKNNIDPTTTNITNNTTNNTTNNNINHTTNNTTVNNFIIIDKLNAFGNESYDHIEPDDRLSCLKQLTQGIYKLCNKIYKEPANQNVRLYKNKKLVQVYNGEHWNVHDSSEIAGKIAAKTCIIGREWYDANELHKWDEERADGGPYYILQSLSDCANPKKNEHHQFKRSILANLHNMKDAAALE